MTHFRAVSVPQHCYMAGVSVLSSPGHSSFAARRSWEKTEHILGASGGPGVGWNRSFLFRSGNGVRMPEWAETISTSSTTETGLPVVGTVWLLLITNMMMMMMTISKAHTHTLVELQNVWARLSPVTLQYRRNHPIDDLSDGLQSDQTK